MFLFRKRKKSAGSSSESDSSSSDEEATKSDSEDDKPIVEQIRNRIRYILIYQVILAFYVLH